MVTNDDTNSLQQSWPRWRFILIGLNSLALVLSIILSWHFLEGRSLIGCGSGSSCEQVLNSRWSTIAGVLPISGLAVGTYLAILFASFFISPLTEAPIRRIAWNTILILIGSVAGSALWYTIIQKWIIGEFCFYCMTTHIIGVLIAALIFWRATKEFYNHSDTMLTTNAEIIQNDSPVNPWWSKRILPVIGRSFIGFVLVGIMAAFQIGFTPPAVYSDGESKDNLITIDYHAAPIIGSPNAPYMVTILFDYQCSHCQQLHLMFDEMIRRFDGKIGFALCPTPLNTQCNQYIRRDVDEFKNSCELAKIGLAVWAANREVFSTFENWMFTFESGDKWHPRSIESAKTKAVELVGKAKFETAWSDHWIGEYMQTCIRIYGQTIQSGNGGIPKLIFGSRWVIPEAHNADDLVMILQKSLGVTR